ncbi:MAG: hypothetical protein J6V14_08590 [Clostridia bacterium]|nr:hypothetical protein [Clostridia bacterium]
MARKGTESKVNRSRAKAAAAIIATVVFALLTLSASVYELSRGGAILKGGTPALEEQAATLKNSVLSGLFHASGNPDVIVGREGWLFYAPTLNDYLGSGGLTDAELDAVARRLAAVRDYCAAQGAEFIFVCVPNKNTVYPEYMPAYLRAARSSDTNLNRLLPLLAGAGVEAPDLPGLMSQAEYSSGSAALYYKTDTHWNARGAAVCVDWLLDKLDVSGDRYASRTEKRYFRSGGDLYKLLYPAAEGIDSDVWFDVTPMYSYGEPPQSMMDMDIVTDNPAAEGRILVFRDSFGSALVPLLSERFGHARYLRGDAPYDFTKVESEQPDAVILVLAERNLRRLLECGFNGVNI